MSSERPLNCDGCGACCRNMSSPPFCPDDPTWLALPENLKTEIDAYLDGPNYDDSAPCIWLKDGRCSHYDHRPEICREFELGSDECVEIRAEWLKHGAPTAKEPA